MGEKLSLQSLSKELKELRKKHSEAQDRIAALEKKDEGAKTAKRTPEVKPVTPQGTITHGGKNIKFLGPKVSDRQGKPVLTAAIAENPELYADLIKHLVTSKSGTIQVVE